MAYRMMVKLMTLWVTLLGAIAAGQPAAKQQLGDYVVLGWNDLGMHCMNGEFSQLVILPPFNDLWVQVIERGDPPQIVTSGMDVQYRFPDNTTSSNKVNFWQYEDAIFGVSLADDMGLAGKGLSGTMDWNGKAWEAHGIPLTPFDDATPTVEQPFQLAEVTLRGTPGDPVLDQSMVVAPVSTEMHCGQCHDGSNNKSAAAKARMLRETALLAAGKAQPKAVDPIVVAQDILNTHGNVDGHSLMTVRPVLCASCHSSNALGTAGRPGLKSLSEAIHAKHGEEFPTLDCYACHPGSKTQCLRGAMYKAGKVCQDCHGSLSHVASSIDGGRRPWLDEPKCGSCHPGYEENAATLYRNSTGHGGLFCAACHGSPHAETPSAQARDNMQTIRLQGTAKALYDCMICHTVRPTATGPHGKLAPQWPEMWMTY